MKSHTLISFVALLAVFVSTWPAVAQPPEVRNFVAHLSGDEEVPPRDTLAQGQAIFHLNSDGTVDYQLIVATIENVVVAHIHCGAPGMNGPVRVFLFGPVPPGGGRTDGVLAEASFDPNGITCPDGTPLLDAMRAGDTYVNVHTNDGVAPDNTGPGDFPGGEVRGQIDPAGPR
jgi:hypothetical protein